MIACVSLFVSVLVCVTAGLCVLACMRDGRLYLCFFLCVDAWSLVFAMSRRR